MWYRDIHTGNTVPYKIIKKKITRDKRVYYMKFLELLCPDPGTLGSRSWAGRAERAWLTAFADT